MYINAAINPLSDESDFFRLDLASTENSPRTLAELANDPRMSIRLEVANNRNTPPEVLVKLAQDPYYDVRMNARLNPNFPKDVEFSLGESIGIVDFVLDFGFHDDPNYFNSAAFSECVTNYLEGSLNYTVISIEYNDVDAFDEPGFDDEAPDTITYYCWEAHVKVDFHEDETVDDGVINFVMDNLIEILKHEFGVNVDEDSSTYHVLLK